MRWCEVTPNVWYADVGPWEFKVFPSGRAWIASYRNYHDICAIGEYKTEKQAKTFAYRRAKALVERMVREVRDP